MRKLAFTILSLCLTLLAMSQEPCTPQWGITTLCCVHLRSEASHSAAMETQTLMGTPLQILACDQEWLWVETPEGYRAWVHSLSVATKSEEEMQQWRQAQRYIYTAMQGHAYEQPHKNAKPMSDMVLGCIVEGVKSKHGYVEIKTPDGRKGYIKASEAASLQEWSKKKTNTKTLIEQAYEMMGTTYLWGGTSTKGADCSGFTKLLYYAQGLILPRNASQQALCGEAVDFTLEQNLRCGDLLFFANDNGRINHVAIYIDNGYYIHSSGCVKINSIRPNNALYNNLVVVAARRIETSNHAITPVIEHPWYF